MKKSQRNVNTSQSTPEPERNLLVWLVVAVAVVVLVILGGIGLAKRGTKPVDDSPVPPALTDVEQQEETSPSEAATETYPNNEPDGKAEQPSFLSSNITCKYEPNETGVTIIGYEEPVPEIVVLPKTLDGKPVTKIGREAFHYCLNLTSVTIPDSVTEIEEFAFSACLNMTSVTIPDSVTTIGEGAFRNCLSLTSVTIPNSVRYIASHVFYETPWLDAQKDTFVICGDGILLKYNGNDTEVVIPTGVKMISSAFPEGSNLTNVTIPDSVTLIGNYAFDDCHSLTSIYIPENVAKIELKAFEDCSQLKSVTMPKSCQFNQYTFSYDCTINYY